MITDAWWWASVPPEVPLVTKSLLARPGWGLRATTEAGHWAGRRPGPALSASRSPGPVPEPETSWEPGAGAVSGLLSSSLHPRYKATLEPGPGSHPPPQARQSHLPSIPRIFTFKSPIHRFAFKCFFSETAAVASQITSPPQPGHRLITNSFPKSERRFYSVLAQSWLELGLAILTTQIRPSEAQYKWWRMRIRRASMIALI